MADDDPDVPLEDLPARELARRVRSLQADLTEAREELDDFVREHHARSGRVAALDSSPPIEALDRAIERLALLIANGGEESDLWLHTEQSEPHLTALAGATLTLATARDRVTPKQGAPR